MDRYSIGIDIAGYQRITQESEDIIKNSLIVVLLSESSNGKLYEYYVYIKQLISKNNKIILLLDGNKSKIRKQICMLMASYKMYDIYNIEDISIINDEYIDTLNNRKPSETEVATFIGGDITAYSDINDIMLKINDKVAKSDIDGLREIIEQERENIERFTSVIDYMKQVVDKANSGDNYKEVENLKNKINSITKELEQSKQSISEQEKENGIIAAERDMFQKEAFNAKRKLSELEEQRNSSEPVIRSYDELQTAMIRCRTKVILYFKEVSHISYISSLIIKYMDCLEQINKLRVKLLIYDNKTSFLSTYKPLPIIGSLEYMGSRDVIVNKHTKLVVVETNQAIIEDNLKADWDVVIIYDRLKQDKDIVIGNNVYKYWVLNSLSEYNNLSKNFKIDKKRVITRPGVLPEALTIQEIANYKTRTESSKLSAYLSMTNMGEDKSRVFDIISNATNIQAISKR